MRLPILLLLCYRSVRVSIRRLYMPQDHVERLKKMFIPLSSLVALLLVLFGPLLFPTFHMMVCVCSFSMTLIANIKHVIGFSHTMIQILSTVRTWLAHSPSTHAAMNPYAYMHAFVVPNYCESLSLLHDTLSRLVRHTMARSHYIIILAMEQSEQNYEIKSESLRASFSHLFRDLIVTVHPMNIPGECRGKGSNVSWAVRTATSFFVERGYDTERIVITVTDADSAIPELYISEIERELRLGAATFIAPSNDLSTKSSSAIVPCNRFRLFAAPIFFARNAQHVPAIVRTMDIAWSVAVMQNLANFRGLVTPCSTYSVTLPLAMHVDYWDVTADAIGEDMHMFLKCFFLTKGLARTTPIYCPINLTNVQSISYLSTMIARYIQARRHFSGSADSLFALRWTFGLTKSHACQQQDQSKLNSTTVMTLPNLSTIEDQAKAITPLSSPVCLCYTSSELNTTSIIPSEYRPVIPNIILSNESNCQQTPILNEQLNYINELSHQYSMTHSMSSLTISLDKLLCFLHVLEAHLLPALSWITLFSIPVTIAYGLPIYNPTLVNASSLSWWLNSYLIPASIFIVMPYVACALVYEILHRYMDWSGIFYHPSVNSSPSTLTVELSIAQPAMLPRRVTRIPTNTRKIINLVDYVFIPLVATFYIGLPGLALSMEAFHIIFRRQSVSMEYIVAEKFLADFIDIPTSTLVSTSISTPCTLLSVVTDDQYLTIDENTAPTAMAYEYSPLSSLSTTTTKTSLIVSPTTTASAASLLSMTTNSINASSRSESDSGFEEDVANDADVDSEVDSPTLHISDVIDDVPISITLLPNAPVSIGITSIVTPQESKHICTSSSDRRVNIKHGHTKSNSTDSGVSDISTPTLAPISILPTSMICSLNPSVQLSEAITNSSQPTCEQSHPYYHSARSLHASSQPPIPKVAHARNHSSKHYSLNLASASPSRRKQD